ncbi:DJ-1/PfpI family protein, partial [Streptomyces sp. NPDC054841]
MMNRRGMLRSAAGAGVAAGLGAGTSGAYGAAPGRRRDRPLRVHIVVFDGAEELDFIGPLEVLRLAQRMGLPLTTTLVTSGEPGRITGTFGTDIAAPGAWDPGAADVIVVPGGGFTRKDAPGIWPEIRKGVLTRELKRAVRPGLTLVGICTGVVVLHAAGLVGDRPCTTHHGAKQYLKDLGADVRDARVVDDGDLVCAGGISSGIDGALWLLEREFGAEAAGRAETVLEFERRGTVLR